MKKNHLNTLLALSIVVAFTACTNNSTNNSTMEMAPSAQDSAGKANIEKTKTIYNYIESGDLSKLGDIIDSNIIEHSAWIPGGTAKGIDVTKKSMADLKAGFPDLKFEVVSILADSNWVFSHFHLTGTNTGAMNGMKGTNKKVDVTGVDAVRIQNGKAVEHWDYTDNVTFMRQMGMMPEMQQPKDSSMKK